MVFDATGQGPDWRPTAFGLIFVVIGIALMSELKAPAPRFMARSPGWFAPLFLGFALVWTGLASAAVWNQWSAVHSAIEQGAPVVEGPVENFHPMPAAGHDDEHFTVGGVYFAYSDYAVTPGFHNSSSHGGPIRAGLHVRIHYAPGVESPNIVKLEVADCR